MLVRFAPNQIASDSIDVDSFRPKFGQIRPAFTTTCGQSRPDWSDLGKHRLAFRDRSRMLREQVNVVAPSRRLSRAAREPTMCRSPALGRSAHGSQNLPDFGGLRPEVDRWRPEFDRQKWLKFHRWRPKLADIGQCCPKFVERPGARPLQNGPT